MGAISGTSRKKLYQELDLEHFRLWLWRMKFFKSEHPQYFFHLIPATFSSHTSSNLHSIPIFNIKQFFFKNSVFLSTISEWNKLHSGLCNSESLSTFRKNILWFIRPAPNSVNGCCNVKGIQLFTWIWFGLSHLREHKFKYNFQDLINPVCNCGHYIEPTIHFLLHYPLFINERSTFFSILSSLIIAVC